MRDKVMHRDGKGGFGRYSFSVDVIVNHLPRYLLPNVRNDCSFGNAPVKDERLDHFHLFLFVIFCYFLL